MIKQSDIVRYSESFCQMIRADREIANGLALVLEVIPACKIGGSTIPARARLHWETGERTTALLVNISVWRGTPPPMALQEWGREATE